MPKDLTFSVSCNFQYGLCNKSYCGVCFRHLNVRIGEDVGISPLTKQLPNSSVAKHLLFCNHSASFEDFSILTRENKKVLLDSKESLLIMRAKPFLYRSNTSAPL